MTERWPKVLSIILALVLVAVIVAYALQSIEHRTLRSSHTQTLQTLQRQTQLIADLRTELAGKHYRNFENEQALRTWVNTWALVKMPIVLEFLDTDIALRGQKYSEYFDCDDLHEAMQRDALRDDYLLDKALVDGNGMIYGVKVSNFVNHAGIMAITDNAYWYVELPTGEIVRIVDRD